MAKGADRVIDHLRDWGDGRRAKVVALAQLYSGKLQGEAQRNAPWTDQSGNARKGLRGDTYVSGIKADKVVITLGHSMDYGVFLELSRDGRYAILKPTIDKAVPEIWAAYKKIWTDPSK